MMCHDSFLKMDKLQPYLSKADTWLSQFPIAVKAEQTTSVPKVYLALSLWLVATASLFFGVLASLTSALIALCYPSYRAAESIVKSDLQGLRVWVVYFVLMSGLQLIELGDVIASLIPFYHVFKTLFVLWLVLPQYLVRTRCAFPNL